jgi:uncharacterized protein YifE (UPF0438 family)
MDNAKTIFDKIPHGEKINEAQTKDLTGLNLGKIKEAKKWMKENGLIESFRGRGGYFAIIAGSEFPKGEEVFVEMTQQEKMAAAKEEKRAKNTEVKIRREQRDKVLSYAKKEFPEADDIQAFWYGGKDDYFYIWVWNGKKAKTYGCYASEVEV